MDDGREEEILGKERKKSYSCVTAETVLITMGKETVRKKKRGKTSRVFNLGSYTKSRHEPGLLRHASRDGPGEFLCVKSARERNECRERGA